MPVVDPTRHARREHTHDIERLVGPAIRNGDEVTSKVARVPSVAAKRFDKRIISGRCNGHQAIEAPRQSATAASPQVKRQPSSLCYRFRSPSQSK
jgi:hypothetical protein